MATLDLRSTLDTVSALARQAGAVAQAAAAGGAEALAIERKADRSFVTRADRACEQLIRDGLERAFPGDSILGEEMGQHGMTSAERVWVVDPIDGTTNFVHGLPLWCIAIGLLEAGQPRLGVLYQPSTGDLFAGAVGLGAWRNDVPMAVNNERQDFENTDPIAFSPHLAQRRLRFPASVRPRSLGSSQLHFAYVACGACRGGLWQNDFAWDIVAGAALVLAAGGVVVTLAGGPVDYARLLDGRRCREGIIACGRHSLPVLVAAARPVVEDAR